MLVAAVVLFWVSYWLISKSESAKWHRYIQGRVQSALSGGRSLALASAAFLAVYREGFETVLFYQALHASAPAASIAISLGFVVGAMALAVVYLTFRRFEIRIPTRQFFFATGLFLYLMAAVFAGQGVHELQGAGLIPLTPVPGIPTIPFIGLYPAMESLAAQAVFAVLLLYASAVTLRRGRRKAAADEAVDVAAELQAVGAAIEGLRREINAIRFSGASAPMASVGERLEDLLVRVEELSKQGNVKVPGNGRSNGGDH